MPTIIREYGFEIQIYTDDYLPPHVHVHKNGAMAKINLDPIKVVLNTGIRKQNLRKALVIIIDNLPLLLEKWREIHESTD